MDKEKNKIIICTTHAIVLNNAFGVAKAIGEIMGNNKYIPDSELELCLLQTYLVEPKKYFDILNSVSWNHGEKRTSEVKSNLLALLHINETPETKGDWWKQYIKTISSYE